MSLGKVESSRARSAPPQLASDDTLLIEQSKRRSIDTHRLDPGATDTPRVLPAGALREHREQMEPLLAVARSGMEHLFQQIRDAGYVVLLTDARGVSVDFITNPILDRELRRAGLYLGGCWSEEIEGTCAVGVCAADRIPVTVHHGEHFRAINSSLTCSAAPIMAPDGKLLAVLDASALHSPGDKRSQHLVLQIVKSAASMIENANFVRQFSQQWILRVNTRREFLEVMTEGLVAFDGGGQIVSVNRRFLNDMGRSAASLVGQQLEDVFGVRFEDIAARARQPDSDPISLRMLHSGSQCFALPRMPRRAEARSAARAPQRAPEPAATRHPLECLAGSDPRMIANVQRAVRVLGKGITVLINGESGTGKEAFAKAMHDASSRAGAAFVALNCAAIPESLIESELFGYRDGAFTGARAKGVRGKISQAHGGTLFLDEIGDMPLALQTRLLRVLAEREVLPLGADQPEAVDLQVICATHRDLMELVHAGQFRLDLFYRLNGLTVLLPALRDRLDKADLIDAILHQESVSTGRSVPTIAPPAMALLLAHPWPGNIRELKNALRSATALCDGDSIEVEHLPPELAHAGAPGVQRAFERLGSFDERGKVPEDAHRQPSAATEPAAECAALLELMKRHRWNISRVAKVLGHSRSTVYRKMEAFGIVPPNRRD